VKVTNEKIENSQAFLTVEMEPAEVEKSLEESYHRLVKKTSIPGFRKGKAPRPVLERYIGKESLFEDALNSLLPEAYEKAVKEQEIEAYAQPHIEVSQTDPLIFKVTVPLMPVVKLGDYGRIRIKPEPVELTEDDINVAIEQLRHQQAAWEPVERPVDLNDLLILDVESHIEDKPFVNQKGVQYQAVPNSLFPAPGFAEQLAGMKKDEEREFKLKFPPDYPRGELAGKESSFKVKVTEIKQEILPELNDELAREINPKFKTLDSLREQVSADLRLGVERKARVDFEDRVIEAVVDTAQVEFPPILVETEIDWLINQQLQRWQLGREGLEEYLRRAKKTEEELREELQPIATKRVTSSLVLGKIAEEEKIKVSDSEIDAEIKRLTKSDTEKDDELRRYLSTSQSRESIRQMLITRKILERLVEIAKGSAVKTKTTVDSKVKEEKK